LWGQSVLISRSACAACQVPWSGQAPHEAVYEVLRIAMEDVRPDGKFFLAGEPGQGLQGAVAVHGRGRDAIRCELGDNGCSETPIPGHLILSGLDHHRRMAQRRVIHLGDQSFDMHADLWELSRH
jgi:hypothetical protein